MPEIDYTEEGLNFSVAKATLRDDGRLFVHEMTVAYIVADGDMRCRVILHLCRDPSDCGWRALVTSGARVGVGIARDFSAPGTVRDSFESAKLTAGEFNEP